MSLSRENLEKAGRLLMVGFHGKEPDDHLREMIERYRVGGVILFRRNVENADQISSMTKRIQELGEKAGYETPLLIFVDQEGDIVSRITDGVVQTSSNLALGAAGNENLARQIGEILGRELASIGINMNLAPVLDLSRSPSSHLGTRCFGDNPATMSKTVIQEILRDKIGYDGLVITNCLEMDAIQEEFGTKQAALKAVKAGVRVHEHYYQPGISGPVEIQSNLRDKEKVVLLALKPSDTINRVATQCKESESLLILISVENPWGFQEIPGDSLLFTYGYTETTLDGLAKVLLGEIETSADLPISNP